MLKGIEMKRCYVFLMTVAFICQSSVATEVDITSSPARLADVKQEVAELKQELSAAIRKVERLERRLSTVESVDTIQYEQLAVSFHEFDSRHSAYRAIAKLGNDALRGQIADDTWVRKQWTPSSESVSNALRDALHSVPVGAMSSIIHDDSSFYIVRVLARK